MHCTSGKWQNTLPVKAKEDIVGEATFAFNIAAKGFYVLCITNRTKHGPCCHYNAWVWLINIAAKAILHAVLY